MVCRYDSIAAPPFAEISPSPLPYLGTTVKNQLVVNTMSYFWSFGTVLTCAPVLAHHTIEHYRLVCPPHLSVSHVQAHPPDGVVDRDCSL